MLFFLSFMDDKGRCLEECQFPNGQIDKDLILFLPAENNGINNNTKWWKRKIATKLMLTTYLVMLKKKNY